MKISVSINSKELGKKAAEFAAKRLNETIDKNGSARLLLSTGASQFDTLSELIKRDIDWSKVEMFHLDEYVNMTESHPASFRKYLKERFTTKVNLKNAYFVNGEGDIKANIAALSEEIKKAPIDVALIGIGENAHIAFNDPPADFEIKEPYIVVELDEKCRMQQVGEGWFNGINDVPTHAISMSVYQIMSSECIISCVPYGVKAKAIHDTLTSELTNMIPATMLKEHKDVTLFIDNDSASMLSADVLNKFDRF